MALVLLLIAPPSAYALSWPLPLPTRSAEPPRRPGSEAPRQRLQEVPPPEWVQGLREVLEERDPQVRILAPADGSLVPDGPWTLRLQVTDWPLVDAGPLGLGSHLVVQLDGQPPRPVVETEVEMPSLSPGSHLLTVYAAKPWGEAHQSPLARQQIRLHRLAPNPATLPSPGTPQLIPVSPVGPAGVPPLLLDWLLIDAPLQGLRTEALGWRLRVTLNGESVLLDRQMPLWLEGWQPGSNALLLELLDGRGDPLNPPFNSLLMEVKVSASPGPGRPRPTALTAQETAVLLGDVPLSSLLPPPAAAEVPSEERMVATPELEPEPQPEPEPEPQPLAQPAESPPQPSNSPMAEEGADPPAVPEPSSNLKPPPEPIPEPQPEASDSPLAKLKEAFTEPSLPPVSAGAVPAAESEESAPVPPQESLVASSPLTAREEVNPDGTLKRPPRPNPLERLRQRLNR